jgi:hypothetical protein
MKDSGLAIVFGYHIRAAGANRTSGRRYHKVSCVAYAALDEANVQKIAAWRRQSQATEEVTQ